MVANQDNFRTGGGEARYRNQRGQVSALIENSRMRFKDGNRMGGFVGHSLEDECNLCPARLNRIAEGAVLAGWLFIRSAERLGMDRSIKIQSTDSVLRTPRHTGELTP